MKHSRTPLVIAFLLFLPWVPWDAAAQMPEADSLYLELKAHPTQDIVRAQLLCDYAWALRASGSAEVLPALQEALAISERLHDAKGMGDANVQIGVLLQKNGDYAGAEAAYLRGLELRQKIQDLQGISSVLNNLGKLSSIQGKPIEAMRYFSNALQIATQATDTTLMAKIAAQLSETNKTLGDFPTSLKYGNLSLLLRSRRYQPDTVEIGKAFNTIANVYEYMGLNERARAAYDSARYCFAAKGDKVGLSTVLNNLGNVEEFDGELAKALAHYDESYHILMVLDDKLQAAKTLCNIARIYKLQTAFERARGQLLTALDLLENTSDTRMKTIVKADLAELDLWAGRPRQALNQLQALAPQIDSFGQPTQRIYYLHIASLAYIGLERFDSSFQTMQTILRLRHQLDLATNAGIYEYDKFLTAENKLAAAKHRAEKLDLEIQVAHRQALLIGVASLFVVFALVLGLFASLQRIRHLHQKRKAMQAKLELELREKEIIEIHQTKELDFLRIALEVEDRERNRIAQDLHNGVGAHVTALMHLLGPLRDGLGASSPSASQALNRFSTDLQSLVEEIRGVAHDLAPPTLKQFGLVPAIQSLKDLYTNDKRIDFELDIHGLEQRLNPKLERNIYSILKELLANSRRHGHATAISIQLVQIDGQLTIVVEDNGKGFDPNAAENQNGIGLASIRNGVRAMEGTMVIDAVIGRGTIVTIEIPNISFTP